MKRLVAAVLLSIFASVPALALEWTVSVIDIDDDLGSDATWDGFDIVITVNTVEVVNKWESGDVDYLLDVSYGDTVAATLDSVLDDYDLALYDHQGRSRDESGEVPSFEPDVVASDVTMIWTVSVLDYGDDWGSDGVWDGFDITIEVNSVIVVDEPESGDVDYDLYVLPGDDIDVWLWSVWDDYDLELYDDDGFCVEYSDYPQDYEPDWMLAEVGGASSGGRWTGDGGGDVAILCTAASRGTRPGAGKGGLLGLVFPALVGLLGLSVLACSRRVHDVVPATRRAVTVRG